MIRSLCARITSKGSYTVVASIWAVASVLLPAHFWLMKWNNLANTADIPFNPGPDPTTLKSKILFKCFCVFLKVMCLLQYAITAITMSRYTFTRLSTTWIRPFIPIERFETIHKVAGVAGWFVLLTILVVYLINWKFLCDYFKQGKEDWNFCADFYSEVMLTGYLLVLFHTAIIVSSIRAVRQRRYELFYWSHHLFIAVFALSILHPMDWRHRRGAKQRMQTWPVMIGPGVLYLFDRIMQLLTHRRSTIMKCTLVSSPKTIFVKFYPPKGFRGAIPGMTCWLNVHCVSWLHWHPFSIAHTQKDGGLYLMIACYPGGWTEKLWTCLAMATFTNQFILTKSISLDSISMSSAATEAVDFLATARSVNDRIAGGTPQQTHFDQQTETDIGKQSDIGKQTDFEEEDKRIVSGPPTGKPARQIMFSESTHSATPPTNLHSEDLRSDINVLDSPTVNSNADPLGSTELLPEYKLPGASGEWEYIVSTPLNLTNGPPHHDRSPSPTSRFTGAANVFPALDRPARKARRSLDPQNPEATFSQEGSDRQQEIREPEPENVSQVRKPEPENVSQVREEDALVAYEAAVQTDELQLDSIGLEVQSLSFESEALSMESKGVEAIASLESKGVGEETAAAAATALAAALHRSRSGAQSHGSRSGFHSHRSEAFSAERKTMSSRHDGVASRTYMTSCPVPVESAEYAPEELEERPEKLQSSAVRLTWIKTFDGEDLSRGLWQIRKAWLRHSHRGRFQWRARLTADPDRFMEELPIMSPYERRLWEDNPHLIPLVARWQGDFSFAGPYTSNMPEAAGYDHVILIGAGSGVVPFLSRIDQFLRVRCPKLYAKKSLKNPLLYSQVDEDNYEEGGDDDAGMVRLIQGGRLRLVIDSNPVWAFVCYLYIMLEFIIGVGTLAMMVNRTMELQTLGAWLWPACLYSAWILTFIFTIHRIICQFAEGRSKLKGQLIDWILIVASILFLLAIMLRHNVDYGGLLGVLIWTNFCHITRVGGYFCKYKMSHINDDRKSLAEFCLIGIFICSILRMCRVWAKTPRLQSGARPIGRAPAWARETGRSEMFKVKTMDLIWVVRSKEWIQHLKDELEAFVMARTKEGEVLFRLQIYLTAANENSITMESAFRKSCLYPLIHYGHPDFKEAIFTVCRRYIKSICDGGSTLIYTSGSKRVQQYIRKGYEEVSKTLCNLSHGRSGPFVYMPEKF